MGTERSSPADNAVILVERWRELRGATRTPLVTDEEVARALMAALAGHGWEPRITAAGLAHGHAAYGAGSPLHQLVKSGDALEGLALDELSDPGRIEMADAPACATIHRLHAACSLLRLATLKGFTRAMMSDLHEQYRDIRHDMKNPLGTIKNALALMADAPTKESDDAIQFRGMASRNAKALEVLIRQRLANAVMEPRALAGRQVRLRELVEELQRDLAAATGAADVPIVIDDDLTLDRVAQIDELALQLLLRSLVATAVHHLAPGGRLTLGFAGSTRNAVRLRVSLTSVAPPALPAVQATDDDVWTTLRSLARDVGACLTGDLASDQLVIEMPTLRRPAGDEGQNLAHSRQAHDLEAGRL